MVKIELKQFKLMDLFFYFCSWIYKNKQEIVELKTNAICILSMHGKVINISRKIYFISFRKLKQKLYSESILFTDHITVL